MRWLVQGFNHVKKSKMRILFNMYEASPTWHHADLLCLHEDRPDVVRVAVQDNPGDACQLDLLEEWPEEEMALKGPSVSQLPAESQTRPYLNWEWCPLTVRYVYISTGCRIRNRDFLSLYGKNTLDLQCSVLIPFKQTANELETTQKV